METNGYHRLVGATAEIIKAVLSFKSAIFTNKDMERRCSDRTRTGISPVLSQLAALGLTRKVGEQKFMHDVGGAHIEKVRFEYQNTREWLEGRRGEPVQAALTKLTNRNKQMKNDLGTAVERTRSLLPVEMRTHPAGLIIARIHNSATGRVSLLGMSQLSGLKQATVKRLVDALEGVRVVRLTSSKRIGRGKRWNLEEACRIVLVTMRGL